MEAIFLYICPGFEYGTFFSAKFAVPWALCNLISNCRGDFLRLTLMDKLIYLVPVMGVIGLLYTFVKFSWVSRQDAGNERMQEIARYIAEGAMAFLKAEWKILSYFVILAGILLALMGYS